MEISEDIQQFVAQEFSNVETEIVIEPTPYGFLVKVRNKKGTFDKYAFQLSGETYNRLKMTAWTLSIPVQLSAEQEAIVAEWREYLRWVWNDAINLLDKFVRLNAYNKDDKFWYPCCPLSLIVEGIRFPVDRNSYIRRKEVLIESRWVDFRSLSEGEQKDAVNKELKERWVEVICTPLTPKPKRRRRGKFRPRCAYTPFPETPENIDACAWPKATPALAGIDHLSLNSCFTQKANPDKDWLKAVPAQAVRYILKELSESFSNWYWYKGGGKPRLKTGRTGDSINAIVFEDAKCVGREWSEDGRLLAIKIPRLGTIAIPLDKQKEWGSLPIATVKIVEDCGWQLQISTSQKPAPGLKPKQSEATIEVVGRQGVLFVDDKQQEYTISYARQSKIEKKIAGKQERLERQIDSLNVAIEQTTQFATRHLAVGFTLLRATGQHWQLNAMLALIEPLIERLKRRTKLNQNQREIKQLHRKNRLAGKSEIQKLATFALRRTGSVKLIDKPYHGMVLKPAPIPTPGATEGYDPNGAAEVAQINRSRKLHRTGAFVARMQQKGEELGRLVEVEKEANSKVKKPRKKSKK